jgi:hypothetical protein
VIRSLADAPSSMTPNKVVCESFDLLLLLVFYLGQGIVMHGTPGADCYQCCIRLVVRPDNKNLLKKGDHPFPRVPPHLTRSRSFNTFVFVVVFFGGLISNNDFVPS